MYNWKYKHTHEHTHIDISSLSWVRSALLYKEVNSLWGTELIRGKRKRKASVMSVTVAQTAKRQYIYMLHSLLKFRVQLYMSSSSTARGPIFTRQCRLLVSMHLSQGTRPTLGTGTPRLAFRVVATRCSVYGARWRRYATRGWWWPFYTFVVYTRPTKL